MIKNLISIVIPCYNGEKYLEKCFDSLLNQTYKKLEVIIVNDGSTDNTKQIISKYKMQFEEKGHIFKNINQENLGQAAAVNNGLKYVTGEYLVWQDSDDYYEYDALENLYTYLQRNKEMNFVRGKALYREEKDLSNILHEGKSKFPEETDIFDFYVFETDSYIFPGVFMVRMEFFDQCIKNREIVISGMGQNWQLILPVAYNGRCGYLDKVVYNYRVREDSHSHSVKKLKDLIKRYDGYQELLFHIFDSIKEMPEQTRRKYKKKVKIKYLKKKVVTVLSKVKHLGR